MENYDIALRLKPDNADAIGNMGNIYLNQGLTDRAIERYQSVLKLKPDNPNAHFNFGVAYLKKRENGVALKEFQTALRLNPALKEAGDFINSISRAGRK
jgi:tetratricopeptide (TPR) repeat protein